MLQQLLTTLKSKDYIINTRPFELNIIGIRSNNATPNHFDDSICILYKRPDGEWIINQFAATTDPGSYWLKTLMNPKGTAILLQGQYKNSHRIGVHRDKYQALVQQNAVTVIRDDDRNAVLDFNSRKQETGIFGINIHRASVKGTTKYVDKHSAGCQVLADVNGFDLLMQLAVRHRNLYGNDFTYTLIEEREFKEK